MVQFIRLNNVFLLFIAIGITSISVIEGLLINYNKITSVVDR